jgi:transposase
MPPKRSFGQEISGNHQRNHEFTPEQRAAMLQLLATGVSQRRIAAEFNTTHSIVQRIKQRWENDHTLKNKVRKGHPKKLSGQAQRYIIRMIKSDRQIKYDALCAGTPGDVSSRTIRRFVRAYYGRKWKAVERPKITKEHARIRLQFCEFWLPRVHELIQACGFEKPPSVILLTHQGVVFR